MTDSNLQLRNERQTMETNSQQANTANSSSADALKDNHFRADAAPPGSALLVGNVTVFNVAGNFCATQAKCTHRQGPLSEGELDGSTVTCPWHGAQFNVCTGAVLRGPATQPLKTYRVVVEGEIGRVEDQE
jgi:nitrite reductase/ring-hydroxylating ferredoxin subunit